MDLTTVGYVRLLLPTLKKDANGMREGRVLTKALRPSCLSDEAVMFNLKFNRIMKLGYSDHEITLDEWKMLVRYEVHKCNPNLSKEDWEEIEDDLRHYTQEDAENLFWGEVAWDIFL